MPRKVLLIHPKDESTAFLLEPIAFFENNIPAAQLDIHIVEPDQKSHAKCFNAIKAGDYDVIFFLGHGSSAGVQGASNEDFECDIMIDVSDLKWISGKDAIFLSCNSADFFKNSLVSHIGFGFMPTDWNNDIISARNLNPNAYKGITEGDINNYCKNLTEILKQPLLQFLAEDSLTLKNCYQEILLRINQIIAINYKELNQEKLAYLMYELRENMTLNVVS